MRGTDPGNPEYHIDAQSTVPDYDGALILLNLFRTKILEVSKRFEEFPDEGDYDSDDDDDSEEDDDEEFEGDEGHEGGEDFEGVNVDQDMESGAIDEENVGAEGIGVEDSGEGEDLEAESQIREEDPEGEDPEGLGPGEGEVYDADLALRRLFGSSSWGNRLV
ncbi:hypothetical protein BDZ45DRAFT_764993 [Acephala macrosclerotiorum]|nr:hypothetical protein BDZ45DRAFT_764993 [Acephala macrosclerotiorum]